MRKLIGIAFLLVLISLAGATSAQAGWVIEGSVGKGGRVNEPRGWEPTNVMLAPGYEVLGLLRPQLGIVGDLGDVKNSKFDLQLRPMLGIYPPIFPIYARAIFAVENLLHTAHYAVGGAVGFKIGLPLIGLDIFAEGGVLPRFQNSATQTVVEGRVGAFWLF
ncbi:MAG TPA: hypothetical protein VH374_15015 [Polyangia bacterium]|jgi:hypothetical protein|nr:hypothetical protein [Polyangia bacterium]